MVSQSSKISALEKILRQEKSSGCRDSTVMGGLDKFLERWAEELVPIIGLPESYSSLTAPERETWVDSVLRLLSNESVPSAGSSGNGTAPAKDTPATSPPRRKPARASQSKLSLDDDIRKLRSVTSQNLPRLKRLGVEKVRDLVYLFPNRHNDFANIRKVADLVPGTEQTVVVTVWEASETGQGPRQRSTQAILGDETGNLRAIWFNQPYLARTFTAGTQVVLSGKVEVFRGQFVLKSPEYELLKDQEELVHTGRLVPVYPSTDRLPQRTLRRVVKQALDATASLITEFLPDDIAHRTGLMSLSNAIAQMHYPDSESDYKAARRRLAFDEMFLMQLAVIKRRQQWRDDDYGIELNVNPELIDGFLNSLPFGLTNAQAKALWEILDDLKKDKPMSRLLQGDVGSGKTIVALAALLAAAFNDLQGALMAPTEILAEQHFSSITHMLSASNESSDGFHIRTIRSELFPKPITVGLLLGSMSKRVKDDMHHLINAGQIDIIVGTQALIQTAVEIPNLALVVVDEQHRFGVMQRASLREKGVRPHLLAMSATPIPRSLALTVYGDLDVSVIDELPPGRQVIRTRWVEAQKRGSAYHFISKQVEEGRQAFIVFPLIEESEVIQARAATQEYERLSEQVFPNLRLGLLHGRMSLGEKERIMDTFKNGDLDILITTPVVEVGIDVPNATVMFIDGADRFGLSQLHQFRGRVGRGQHQSYCLLLSDSPGPEAQERVKIVERVSDGFQLAEEDLRIRGPGDYLGTRQSGLPDLKIASIMDQEILSLARREAIKLLDSDPDLQKHENSSLAAHFKTYASGLAGELS
jgi:ATP-dependent DNA helicase RecG